MAYPHARSARGAALIIAMVLVAVLAVVALALVRRSNNEMDAIGGKRNYDRSVSCAEAGGRCCSASSASSAWTRRRSCSTPMPAT